ncbi:hypothetical protein LG331_09745 [Vreelandella aquamarina]|uniref:hypothetical protein n=1 Tax=Vreelandella aquamarina TaxID=77097 RepID=UPI00384EFDA4
MQTTVMKAVEIEIERVKVSLPVRHDDEDMPYDFPLRNGDVWEATIMVDSGQIIEWPEGQLGEFEIKVCDEGSYTLLSPSGEEVGSINQNYVPNGLIPGEYGDYVSLKIGSDGVILNWPERPSVEEFFQQDED